jgi:hypothetical protein
LSGITTGGDRSKANFESVVTPSRNADRHITAAKNRKRLAWNIYLRDDYRGRTAIRNTYATVNLMTHWHTSEVDGAGWDEKTTPKRLAHACPASGRHYGQAASQNNYEGFSHPVESEDLCSRLLAKAVRVNKFALEAINGRWYDLAGKRKNGVNIEHEHHLFKLTNVHGSEAEQKRKER